MCAGLLHLQQCSVPALCCPVARREQVCPKLQQKSGVPDFSGGSLCCPGLCAGGQGRAAVTGGRAGLKKLSWDVSSDPPAPHPSRGLLRMLQRAAVGGTEGWWQLGTLRNAVPGHCSPSNPG